MTASIGEVIRYGINGVVATAVHFSVLTVGLRVFEMSSAGLANLIAAVVGISVSFVGSRYFVFRRKQESLVRQAVRFGVLYALIAVLHGLVLLVWTDWQHHDYRTGFLLATVLQVTLSYFGNKFLVFRA